MPLKLQYLTYEQLYIKKASLWCTSCSPCSIHTTNFESLTTFYRNGLRMISSVSFYTSQFKKAPVILLFNTDRTVKKVVLGGKKITGAISSLLFAYHTSGWWLRWYQLEVSQMSQLNCLKCPKLCLCIYVCVCASVSVCMCFCLCASSHTLLNIFKFFNLMTCDWRFKSMCEHSIISSF